MDKKTFEELVFQNGIQLGDSPYDPTKLTIDQGTNAAPDDLFSSATYIIGSEVRRLIHRMA